MPLEFQNIELRFTDGLDTRTQPKLVLPAKWRQLNNLSLSGDLTPRRRDGIDALVQGTNARGLALHNNELLVLGDTVANITNLQAISNQSAAIPVPGQLGYVYLRRAAEVLRASAMVDMMDVATNGTLTVYVWRDKDPTATVLGVNYLVVNEATQSIVTQSTQLRAGAGVFCPKVVWSFDRFIIMYRDGGPARLFARDLQTNLTLGVEQTILNSASLPGLNFDACGFGDAAAVSVAVAYPWSDGATSVRSLQIVMTAGVPALGAGPTNIVTEAQLPIANFTGVTACAFNGTPLRCGIWSLGIGATAMAGTAGATIDTTWAVTAGPTQLDATVGPAATPCHICAVAVGQGVIQRARVFYDQRSARHTARLNPLRAFTVDTAQVAFAAAATLINSNTYRVNAAEPSGPEGPWIAGKPFAVVGNDVVSNTGLKVNAVLPVSIEENWVSLGANTNNPNAQNSFYLLDGLTGSVAAHGQNGSFGLAAINGNAPVVATPCNTPLVATDALGAQTFGIANPEATHQVTSGGLDVTPVGIARLNLIGDVVRSVIKRQLGPSTFFAGGSLTQFDGTRLTELGFNLYPEGISAVAVAGAGANDAGVHQVCAVYEWIDGQGQIHQSAPSPTVSVTFLAAGHVNVIVPTLQLTQKPDVNIVVYATQANGTIFNRCTLNNGAFVPLANNKAATSVTWVIADADATIAQNELLYSQPDQGGTTLPAIVPPPCTTLGVHEDRLWCDASDAPPAFWFSQRLTSGVGMRWSDSLVGLVDSTAGQIQAFQSIDEKLLLATSNGLWCVFGVGPNAAGQFSQFSNPPIQLPSDVGCSEPRSVLLVPQGLVFKSNKGWYLLTRDLMARYIGDGVSQYDAQDVSSAVLDGVKKECRFGSTAGARQLIWAYEAGQWSTTSVGGGDWGVSDAVWWPTTRRYTTACADNAVCQEVAGKITDDTPLGGTTEITCTMQTSWLKLATIAGFQRVRYLYLTGTATVNATTSEHLTLAVDYDDGDSNSAPGSYTVGFDVSPGSGNLPANGMPIDLKHKLRRQKCKSVAFTIAFARDDSLATVLIGFQALGLSVGIKRGLNKLPAAQNVG